MMTTEEEMFVQEEIFNLLCYKTRIVYIYSNLDINIARIYI